jgi:nicotinamide mononucleotide (NMN) deamidase PncC
MEPELEPLILAIHQSNCPCVLVTTGGGATAASWLLSFPGASRTVLEVLTPYSESALCQFLGKRPQGFCTTQTAMDMAEAAWARAQTLASGGRLAGIGCTASLATDRPKRGDHRFHAALAVEDKILVASLTFDKDARTRAEEETIVSRAILNLLAQACGVQPRLTLALRPGELLECDVFERGAVLAPFLRTELSRICAGTDGRLNADAPAPGVLMPGSFNPLHDAHRKLLQLAMEYLGVPGAFELSVTNVDKPPLGLGEIRRRLEQFHGRAPVWLTRASSFVEKSRLFPNCAFVIGHDTASRLVSPQYYNGMPGGMDRAIAELRERGGKFLVAARVNADGVLLGVEDLLIPDCFQGLLEGIPKSRFHNSISSTELRRRIAPLVTSMEL